MKIHVYIDNEFVKTFSSEKEINNADLGKVAIVKSEPMNDDKSEINLYLVTVDERPDELRDKLIMLLKKHEGNSFEGTLESADPDTFQFISYIPNVKLNIGESGIVVADQRERYYFTIPFENLQSITDESDDRRPAYNISYKNGYYILVEINNEY
ncbi:hypothetical protein BSK66_31885 [Paenibacillus odorifer]|uniref:hypothetical protein n=1 Tax=Paenibacillus TaxID=44249 RepID=UPI0003E2C473|nr:MULTISPECIES: hypothetical protein [Paenibacillus]ETT61039.1 hypothetical protein C171_13505 [Paenibacillus sp. FSL H8-237]OMD13712.1 hypothetical protein BJP47_24090 [Paenibacillus odorifer]OME46570.1 hypothetical protein BSK66_31885 [Paenibacillus odorifer]